MEYLRIGKFTNTHGLKGEIKIQSDLSNTNSIFNIDNTLYLGQDKIPFIINTHRKHQQYDMVTSTFFDSIDKVLPYKGESIYISKDDIKENLFENLIGYDVINNDNNIGQVIELLKGVKYNLIVVSDKRIIIPFIKPFIIDVDRNSKTIKTNYMI
jgi:16S rRNA processing protein RimM